MEDLLDAEREINNWMGTAKRYYDGQEGFRAWLEETALLFGDKAYIADDGSRSQSPLLAKVPDLVRDLIKERDKLKEQLNNPSANGT